MPKGTRIWPEAARLAALRRYDILDTPPEAEFDALTKLAAHICDTPIALVTLVNRDRQWFKSELGLGLRETGLDASFCKHAILENDLLVIEDATQDSRSRENPLVTRPPHVRFYAGAVLRTGDGLPFGTLCVLDHVPRALDAFQREALTLLARQVMTNLELRHARRRLSEAIETIGDAFVTVDHDFRVNYMNAAAEEEFKVSREQRLGRVIWEDCARGPDGSVATKLRQVAETRQATRFDVFYDPTEVWLEVSVDPSPDGLTLYVRDVTERRSREEVLRLLESAVARLNDLVMITKASPLDEPGPRIVYVNDTLLQRTGWRREEVLGRSPRFLHGARTDRLELDRIRAALEEPRPVRAELINYTKSGEPFWLDLVIAPVRGDDGQLTHFVSVARQIDERKRAEAATREMQERLETLVGEARVGILVHRNFRPLIANEELARIFGYAGAEEVLAMTDCRLLFAEPERERMASYNRARLEGGTPPDFYSTRGLRRDGTVIELENRAFAIRWGEETAVCAMLTDVTEQRRVEAELRQAQRLEAVGLLTGGIAHDFNNLLTVVLGNAELIEEGLPAGSPLRPLAGTARKAAERGADLTQRLLTFARRQSLHLRPVNVALLASDMQALLHRTLGEQIEMSVNVPEGLWEVLADSAQLENAVLNLCVNARDAMPRGGRLTIEASNVFLDSDYTGQHAEVVPGEYVLIAVSDSGEGMDPETLARAFEPFFTTKAERQGSGLGLSTVHGFIKQSGGHVSLYSQPGQGTTVWLYLPRATESETRREAELPEAETIGGSERVLVVEDNELVRVHAVMLLGELGYEVVEAGNGPEALELLRRGEEVDLLFTDIVMPGGMSGIELADEARKLLPGLPVLFTSGYIESAVIHHGRLDPGSLLLQKPYRRQELARKIRAALDAGGQTSDRSG